MADVTPQTRLVYQSGDCNRAVLLSVRGCTAGDTVDTYQWLNVVKLAGLVSATGLTIASFAAAVAGQNATLTKLTIPAGPANDAVWVIATGIAGPG